MTAGPALRLSMGIVVLLASALMSANMFFDIVPSPTDEAPRRHREIAEICASNVASRMAAGDYRAIERELDAARQAAPDLLSISVRNERDETLAVSGAVRADPANERIDVPIRSRAGGSASVRLVFSPSPASADSGRSTLRKIALLAALALVFTALTYLYLRRALLYLDPMSVVPERLRTVFDSLTEGIAVLDSKHRVVLGNKALRDMCEIEDHKLLGRRLEEAVPLEFEAPDQPLAWRTVVATGKPVRGTRVAIHGGQEARTGSMNCAPILDGLGKVRGCLVTVADVTDIERSNDQLRSALLDIEAAQRRIETQNEELKRLAQHDGLTALLNRRAFFENAAEAIARQAADSQSTAILMLDVDHFKSFNDRFGHATGDAVLQRVARCLEDCVRPPDLAARYGGEEFCVLVDNIDQAGALRLAERIRARIESEAGAQVESDTLLTVTVSIGVMAAPARGADLAAMVRAADAALYASKHAGRNRVTLAPVPEAAATAAIA